jgi:hypothetical protein
VFDHLADVLCVDGAVQVDGVPVTLVRVVAGSDGGVSRAQLQHQGRVALEGHAARAAQEGDQREHPTPDLEDGHLVAEGVVLHGVGEPGAQVQDVVATHAHNPSSQAVRRRAWRVSPGSPADAAAASLTTSISAQLLFATGLAPHGRAGRESTARNHKVGPVTEDELQGRQSPTAEDLQAMTPDQLEAVEAQLQVAGNEVQAHIEQEVEESRESLGLPQ